jgi:hypothetical protein
MCVYMSEGVCVYVCMCVGAWVRGCPYLRVAQAEINADPPYMSRNLGARLINIVVGVVIVVVVVVNACIH